MITIYGIPNCDTVKKAQNWLKQHEIAFTFHDFRKDGLKPELVDAWLDALGPTQLINKRSTTWKQLNKDQQEQLMTDTTIELIVQNPTLIKRPVLDTGTSLSVGFKPEQFSSIFNI
ncbi:MAG: arsenate reductase [Flavobacteriales bacterium]|jgi:arsenate reductase